MIFFVVRGASKGLHNAGFRVVGVDIKRSKNYPYKHIESDALEVDLSPFKFVWASPPCQFASENTQKRYRANHQNLIPAVREKLILSGLPYIIENVENARHHLIKPIMLCGSMFGLKIFRHRYFESNFLGEMLKSQNYLPMCNHSFVPVAVGAHSNRLNAQGERIKEPTAQEQREAMEIDWMNRDEVSQAIPPRYAEFLGKLAIEYLTIYEN